MLDSKENYKFDLGVKGLTYCEKLRLDRTGLDRIGSRIKKKN